MRCQPRLLLAAAMMALGCLAPTTESSGDSSSTNCSSHRRTVVQPRKWQWETAADAPGRYGHSAERLVVADAGSGRPDEDVVALFGGVDTAGSTVDSSLHVYSTRNSSWAAHAMASAAQPDARSFHASFARNGSAMYVHGGLGASNALLDDLWLAELSSTPGGSRWRQVMALGAVPVARYAHSFTLLGNASGFNTSFAAVLFGGQISSHEPSNAVHYAKITAEGTFVRWVTATFTGEVSTSKTGEATGQPDSRGYHAMAPWGTDSPCALLFGGQNARIQRVYEDTWKLCLVDATGASKAVFNWTKLPALHGSGPSARWGHAITVVDPGRLVLYGGSSSISPPTYLSDAFLLDTRLRMWEPLTTNLAADARVSHAVVATGRGIHLVAGYQESGAITDHHTLNMTTSVCGAGYYMQRCTSDGVDAVVCTKCPRGYYGSGAGAYSCDTCVAGTYSEAAAATLCDTCPAGTYSTAVAAANRTTCQACAAGRVSTAVGASSASSCTACPSGHIQPEEGSTACRACRAGSVPNASATGCVKCAAGRTAGVNGSSACAECPAGSIAAVEGSSACTTCGDGEYASAGSSTCEICSGGHYSSAGDGACSVCPAGTYSSSNSSSCSSCPLGTASSVTASNTSSSCLPCDRGYIAPSLGSSSCTACPAGTYNNFTMGTACTDCPKNTYLTTTGGRSHKFCSACPMGTFTLGDGKTSSDSCYSCPPGRHADRTSAGCIECERGRFTNSHVAASNFNCSTCAINTYASETGQRNCTACSSGSYSHGGHAECIPCSLNSTLRGNGTRLTGYLQSWQPDDENLWTLEDASLAAGGSLRRRYAADGPDESVEDDAVLNVTSCDHGAATCPCASVYQDVTLGVENRMLFLFRGFARTGLDSLGTVDNISMTLRIGSRAELQSKGALVETFDFSTSAGWSGRQSFLFPAAVSGAATGGVARVTLGFCGRGSVEFSRPGLFAAPTFACACSGATYVSAYNQDDATSTCTRCPAGSACSSGSIAPCLAGTYSFGGSTECSACRDGWRCRNGLSLPCGAIGEVKGGGETDECQRCPEGHRCANGVAYSCPVGKWSPGGMHATQCLNCLPGTFSNRIDSPNCTECSAGRTSNFGVSQCRSCQPGEFSRSGSICETCGAGSYSTLGSTNCTACPAGRYSPGPGMWRCLACTNETKGDDEGGPNDRSGATTANCDS